MRAKLDSYIVSLFGLDGKREHYMPGNRRRGTGVREKRPFDTEAEARAFIEVSGWPNRIYQCSICGKWHTAKPARQ
jgi:hypothetical protein